MNSTKEGLGLWRKGLFAACAFILAPEVFMGIIYRSEGASLLFVGEEGRNSGVEGKRRLREGWFLVRVGRERI